MDTEQMKTLRASLWDFMNRVGPGATPWAVSQWLSMDPASCERQELATRARDWLETGEGRVFEDAKLARETDRQMRQANLDYRRSMSEARASQLK